jgi:uncharacterized protein YuzE
VSISFGNLRTRLGRSCDRGPGPRTEADPRDASLTRSFKAVAAFGNRVLRVVYRPDGDDIRVSPFRPGSQAMIQTTYDPEADAMSVWFAAPGITASTTEEVAPGMMLDFDSSGQVLGIEVLGVRRRSQSI